MVSVEVKQISPPIPDLDLLVAVANTGHDGVDELTDPTAVETWWRRLSRGTWQGPTGSADDVAMLRRARDLIRATTLRNNGVDVAVDLDALGALPLRFVWADGPDLQVSGSPSLPWYVAGRVLLGLLRATAYPNWHRVKACPGPDCGWVFVDGSRNASRRWCQMSECGNRAKGAAFRERTRSSRAG
jgi:predicted RNA-binding Zn ribbon-like protein